MSELPGIAVLQALGKTSAKGNHAAMRKTAEEFESVFVNQLLESMSEGLKTDGPFTGGEGESTYRSLLNDSIAKAIAKKGGIGIADQVYREMIKMQEGQSTAAAPGAKS